MPDPRLVSSAMLLGMFFVIPGCQRGEPRPEGMPELFPVSVTIVQDGTPLADASVRLIPDEGTSPWSSGGSTGANGVAVLRTHGRYQGVPAGSYRMTVSKIEMPTPPSAELTPLDASPTSNEPTYNLVAPEYGYPNQTPLRLEVTAERNTYDPFDVGPAVRIERKGPPTP